MGAGKTTLARALDPAAVDADAVFAEHHGPIDTFFAAHGEGEFRRREEALALGLLARDDVAVLALGGGAVESRRVRGALGAHTVVLLEVDPQEAWRRVRESGRPLARDREAFLARFTSRAALYEQVADVFVPEGVRPSRSLLERLPAGARLTFGRPGDYPVVVGRDVLDVDPAVPGRRFVVADAEVAGLVGGHDRLAVPGGEQSKTLAGAERVWRWLADRGATRGDHVAAVGGGVVGDLVGFCAATYQRGVPVVQVPTTVVAQVDSALGGKTGVDLPEAKNYVGAYHHPSAVLADVGALATLPAAEHAAGYAEVVKTALIAGGRLWERVAAGAPVDADVVFACARTKLGIVAADERDAGLRQVLNLGHTVGHALETVTGYAALRHGEAVGLGLLAALRLSGQDALRGQVAGLLAGAGLPTAFAGADPAAVVAATKRDKKRTGDEVPFVLVDAPGAVRPGARVEDRDVLAAVRELAGADDRRAARREPRPARAS